MSQSEQCNTGDASHVVEADEHARIAVIAELIKQDLPDFAWLDGGHREGSYLGCEADMVLEGDDAALLGHVDRLRAIDPARAWVGGITYEFAVDLLLGRAPRARRVPGLWLRRYAELAHWCGSGPVAVYGQRGALARALAGGMPPGRQEQPQSWPLEPLRAELTPGQYRDGIRRVHEHLVAGDSYQVNVAQPFTARWARSVAPLPLAQRVARLYRQVRDRSPAPLGALLRYPDGFVLSNSPETLVQIEFGAHHEANAARCLPIKGTRPRQPDHAADKRALQDLVHSTKDRAEHVMIVDLIRNDLGQLAVPGTVHVTKLAAQLSLPTVHHLVTEVWADLPRDVGLEDIVRALVPGGSITGAPKRRTVEIIEEIEHCTRGIYCGAIFVLTADQLCMSVPIRTGWVDDAGLRVHAGGGIVLDSEPEAERHETIDKVRAFEG